MCETNVQSLTFNAALKIFPEFTQIEDMRSTVGQLVTAQLLWSLFQGPGVYLVHMCILPYTS